MKRHWILLVLLAVGLVLGTAFARNRRGRRPAKPPRGPSLIRCLREIELTPEQTAEIDAIRQAAMEALREAETPEEAREIIEQMQQAIEDVLTEDQLAALQQCLQPRTRLTCLDQIGLTPEQIAEIDAIRQAAIEALREVQSPQEAREIIEQMHQAIEDVLTDEQLAALRECLRPRQHVNCMEQIGLTEEQIAVIDAIREAAMQAISEAETREEVRQILNQMHDDIMAVLTAEQLAALQECRDANRRPRPGPGPG